MEDFIKELYASLGVFNPIEIDMHAVANDLNIKLRTWNEPSEAAEYGDKFWIFLNEELDHDERWQDFGHELCHVLQHEGYQQRMPRNFVLYQEIRANNFMYHFCVPTFMLETYDFPKYKQQAIQQVSQDFNVTPRFARKRLDMYQNKQMQYQYHQKIQHSIVAEKQSVYSTEQMMDMDFNLDNGILPDEVYEHHDLSVDKESKVRKTIQFIKDMRVRGLL